MKYPNDTHASAHLSWAELACKDGTPYPRAWRYTRGAILAQVFEIIRGSCGHKPITVLSAYRTPTHNRKVGGAHNSQHLDGRAIDLKTPAGWKVSHFYARIRELAILHPTIRGLGLYTWGVHVDIRSSPRLVVWDGGALPKDSKTKPVAD